MALSVGEGQKYISELYRIAALSTAEFQAEPNVEQIVSNVFSGLEKSTLQIPAREMPKFIRKLVVVEDRIDNPGLDPIVRQAVLDQLGKIHRIVRGGNLHEEDRKAEECGVSYVHSLWHYKHVRIDTSGELRFSKEFADETLTDGCLEEILTHTSTDLLEEIIFIALDKYKRLARQAPVLLVRHLPWVSFGMFRSMHTHPDRFCDHLLVVEGKRIPVNIAFLSEMSDYFRALFTTSMQGEQKQKNETVLATMRYAPLNECLLILLGIKEKADVIDEEHVKEYLTIAQTLMSPTLYAALERTFLSFFEANIEQQEDSFEVVVSWFDQFTDAFDAGKCRKLQLQLKEIVLQAVDLKLTQIEEQSPATAKSSYLAGALSRFLGTLAPCRVLRECRRDIEVKLLRFLGRSYILPGDIIPLLERQRTLYPDCPLHLIVLAIAHLNAECNSNWQEAIRLLQLLVKESNTLDDYGLPYILLADAYRQGTVGIVPNPEAAKEILDAGLQVHPHSVPLVLLKAQILFKDEDNLEAAITTVAETVALEALPYFLAYLRLHDPNKTIPWISSIILRHADGFGSSYAAAKGQWERLVQGFFMGSLVTTTRSFSKQYIDSFMWCRQTRILYSFAKDILDNSKSSRKSTVVRHMKKLEKQAKQ